MKDVSLIQKLITWTVVISLIIVGLSVFLQKDVVTPNEVQYTPVPTNGPAPIPVYPNNGKE